MCTNESLTVYFKLYYYLTNMNYLRILINLPWCEDGLLILLSDDSFVMFISTQAGIIVNTVYLIKL